MGTPIEQSPVTAQLNVLPNPADGQVTLEIILPQGMVQVLLQITDAAGRIVHSAPIVPGAPSVISVQGLSAGTYNCTLRMGDGTPVATRALVVP